MRFFSILLLLQLVTISLAVAEIRFNDKDSAYNETEVYAKEREDELIDKIFFNDALNEEENGEHPAENSQEHKQKTSANQPPAEAIEACNSKVAGGDCYFRGKFGEDIIGSCKKIGKDLACVSKFSH